MNNTQDIFEEYLSALEGGESLENLEKRFPEVARFFAEIQNQKETITPNAEGLRRALNSVTLQNAARYSEYQKGRAVFTSLMKINWKIAVPATAFAVVALAVLVGTDTLSFPTKQNEATNQESLTQNTEALPEVTALTAPIPEANGKADDMIAAMFTEMDQEFAAFDAQANASIGATNNESNTLNNFTYEETQI